jgi:hypothetical protein
MIRTGVDRNVALSPSLGDKIVPRDPVPNHDPGRKIFPGAENRKLFLHFSFAYLAENFRKFSVANK